MKKILLSLLTILLVGAGVAAGTSAYFSDTEINEDNQITIATLDITMEDHVAWEFPFTNMAPGDTTGMQRQKIAWPNGSLRPDHLEFRVTTSDFVDGTFEDLPASVADDLKKEIEIVQFNLNGPDQWKWQNLIAPSVVDASADGDASFVSLFDLEAAGVLDDFSMEFYPEHVEWRMEFKLHEDAGNLVQGDSIMIDFEVGAAQVAGQDVLL